MDATNTAVSSRRRFTRRILRAFARRSDGTGPHFLPGSQNARISGGVFTQVVGPTIIQQYNLGGDVSTGGLPSGNNPLTFPGDHSSTYGPNGERLSSTSIPVPATQLPTRRYHDTYQDLLEREGYGFPFWIPSPNIGLQAEYRYEGVALGDVGVFTPHGGFDYLFNICLPSDHPRNSRRMPEDFQPLYPPLQTLDTMEFEEFDPGSYVASRTVTVHGGEEDVPLTSTTFETNGSESAILIMPRGATVKELINISRFTTYLTAERILSFYRFVNDVDSGLGRGIRSGQLRVVYGCTKGQEFAMASAPSSPAQSTRLQFRERGHDNTAGPTSSGRPLTCQDKYIWNISGRARGKVGPGVADQEGLDPSHAATSLKNQCFFVKTLDLQLSSAAGQSLQDARSGVAHSTSSPTEKQDYQAISMGTHSAEPSSSAVMGSIPPSNLGPKDDDVEIVQLALCPHLSTVLKRHAFEKYPHAKAMIVSDRDWLHTMLLYENTPSNHLMSIYGGPAVEILRPPDGMFHLIDRDDGVIFFEPGGSGIELESTLHRMIPAMQFNTMSEVRAYLFGNADGNRSSAIADIIQEHLWQFSESTTWKPILAKSRRLEHNAPFRPGFPAHPIGHISLIEILVAKFIQNYVPPEINELKQLCQGSTGESNLTVISILAHRLLDRFRYWREMEDLHQAIFYYQHIIEENNMANKSTQWEHLVADSDFNGLFWIYPAALVTICAALHLRVQIQGRESDYQLLLQYLDEQKKFDLLFVTSGRVRMVKTQDGPSSASQGEASDNASSSKIGTSWSASRMPTWKWKDGLDQLQQASQRQRERKLVLLAQEQERSLKHINELNASASRGAHSTKKRRK